MLKGEFPLEAREILALKSDIDSASSSKKNKRPYIILYADLDASVYQAT